MTRAVFMGTPQEAVPSLAALNRVADLDLVVTRPDRRRGRSGRPVPPPVKQAAEALGLEVAQPAEAAELFEVLAGRSLDVGVVVAFGMILPPGVLALPRRGFLNVHFSLLPRWRGAAPVERALMAGDTESGVTIMAMDEGLDTGPVIAQQATPIDPQVTAGELRARLADLGAELAASVLADWVAGRIAATPQPATGATYAHRLDPADRDLDPSMTVEEANNRIRALAPTPGARIDIDGEAHKVLAAAPSDVRLQPGEWRQVAGAPVLGLRDGSLRIVTIQPPGRRAMAGDAWLRGRRLPA